MDCHLWGRTESDTTEATYQQQQDDYLVLTASLVAQTVKNLPTKQVSRVQSLNREDALEKGMATHSRTLAWKILWTEEPGGLPSMGSHRVGHD